MKPVRHVVHLAELTTGEATELGPLLVKTADVVTKLSRPEQVYVSLWSHAAGKPDHVHFVLQPITTALVERFGARGTRLQMAMLEAGEWPDPGQVEIFATQARTAFAHA